MSTATDLFAGAGGSSEGLRQAGFDVVLAANHDPLAVATHEANHPGTEHRIANLKETDPRTLPWTYLLSASPSCVWHAPAGGRTAPSFGRELVRSDLGAIDRATAFVVIAAVEAIRYPVVIVENVPEFRNWTLYGWWTEGLRQLGYTLRELVVDASDYGVPQRRKRLVIVAELGQARIDITPPDVAAVPAAAILDADPGRPRKAKLYAGVERQLASIDPEQRHLRHIVTWRRNARAKLAVAEPLSTVTAGGRHHGVAQDIDGVTHLRVLNPRELARAQAFPEHYRFLGTAQQQVRQIGNAVPVGVMRHLGERVLAAM